MTAVDTTAAVWLTASPDTFAVAPGDSQAVSLTAHPAQSGSFATTVFVRSDDPFRAQIPISLQGNARYPTGLPALPTALRLYQNQPNPFRPRTVIRFTLAHAAPYALSIYSATGQRIRGYEGVAGAEGLSVTWEGNDAGGARVAPGVYFYRLESEGRSDTRRMILLP